MESSRPIRFMEHIVTKCIPNFVTLPLLRLQDNANQMTWQTSVEMCTILNLGGPQHSLSTYVMELNRRITLYSADTLYQIMWGSRIWRKWKPELDLHAKDLMVEWRSWHYFQTLTLRLWKTLVPQNYLFIVRQFQWHISGLITDLLDTYPMVTVIG